MKNIEQLVDETLNSLDNIERAEANPYLYTRIQQRLKARNEVLWSRKLMPAMAVALILFIGLNVMSFYKLNNTDTAPGENKSINGLETFAKEYNLSEDTGS